MPEITIGMPVYNGERFLEGALRSILAQTAGDFELLISDNASTDRTREIVRDIAARDRRIELRANGKNLGATQNYNVLVGLARGRFFKWAAHDDLLAPEYLERCMRELVARPDIILCYPATTMIDAFGKPTGTDPRDAVRVSAGTPHERFRGFMASAWPTLGCNAVFGLIRLDALKNTRLVGNYASADKILLGELALLGKFHQLTEPLFLRREHAESSVRANPGVHERNQWFDPLSTGQPGFIHWKWVAEYLKGIYHSPISTPEKLRCIAVMRQHVERDKERLRAELKRPLKLLLSRAGVRAGKGS